MSDWNKQGEECDCGSSAAHERVPGCTPPRTVGLDSMSPPRTPAAMLGEAEQKMRDVVHLLGRAGCADLGAEAVRWFGKVRDVKRDAEAREVPQGGHPTGKPETCWQCDAPLGATEACMTCEAKRREGQP